MNDYSLCVTNERFRTEHFDITNLEDEINVDRLCSDFLKIFHRDLTEKGLPPDEAGSLAHGADYFLRDFVIAEKRENIFKLKPERIRQFAGNWYIIKTLEPNMVELESILDGVEAFYSFADSEKRLSEGTIDGVKQECAQREFYSTRIESFWAIEGDGYLAWDAACPLES